MKLDFKKMPGALIPAIVQDAGSGQVLMLGYMNGEALRRTLASRRVWFYSRSRKGLWMKGESSGNMLELVAIMPDCDGDALLVKVRPTGPACHTGADTCFNEENRPPFLSRLESIISERRNKPEAGSYTASLFAKGVNAIAQKVGEEAVELIIEAKDGDPVRFRNEAADLLFHYLVLLQLKGLRLADIEAVLQGRN